ncbi:MAG TPA: GNAT family N-acetyltransferase [Holophagaceae bacterium]|nr:GNAT family N-acetyltransferase [Holophagaceae bacterium]
MPNYILRPATESDAPQLARLLTELGHPTTSEGIQERWAGWAEAGNGAIVAEDPDGSLLGVITLHRMTVLHRPRPVGRITSLVVTASSRGTGLGRSLMTAAEAALMEAGCGLVEITSHDRRVEAHAFYEHLGYVRTSIRLARECP